MASLSYPKSVRLHYRKDFQALLESASTHYNAVFKVFWLVRECPEEVLDGIAGDVACAAGVRECNAGAVAPGTGENVAGCRFAVSVPKKSFKRAVKRNLLKRRTREAIRLNRRILPEGFCGDFLFFYRVGEVLDYADIEKAVVETFTAVTAKIQSPAAPARETPARETAEIGDSSSEIHTLAPETAQFRDENTQSADE